MPYSLSGLVGSVANIDREKSSQTAGFAPSHLKALLANTGEDRQRFARVRDKHIASIGSKDLRLSRRLQGSLSSQIAQGFGGPATSFAGALDDSVRKARVRAGIANRGEAAAKNQQLKDRIEIVRAGQRRTGALANSLSTAANIREGVNVGVKDANERIDASKADLLGGTLGGITGLLETKESRTNALGGLKKLGGLFGIGGG